MKHISVIKDIKIKINIYKSVTFYNLRSNYAIFLLESETADLRYNLELLSHSSSKTMGIYVCI